jgi:hypothetical protein
MSDPLASLRSKLAGQPHVVTSVATPSATSSKTDPLAAVRAKVKGGKAATSTPVTSTTAKQLLLADFQLDQLYQKGTQGKPPQIQHIAGLKAVYQAGLSGATTV